MFRKPEPSNRDPFSHLENFSHNFLDSPLRLLAVSGCCPVGQYPIDKMKRITIRLPDALYAVIEGRAEAEHRDVAKQVRFTLSQAYEVPDVEELDEASNPKLPLP